MRRALEYGAMVLALSMFVPGPSSGEMPAGQFPAWSTGDIEFSVDVLGFQGGDDRTRVQVTCSVTNEQIRFVEDETGEASGRLLMEVTFEDEGGEVVDHAERRIAVGARSMLQAENRDVIQLLQLERHVNPGRYLLRVKLSDLNAPKVGIWYAIRGVKRSGEVAQVVDIRDFRTAALGISDIAFARSIRPDSVGGEFAQSGLEVIPNPSHLYGLRLAELPVYMEVYDGRSDGPADTLMMEYVIRDPRGQRVLGQTRGVAGSSRRPSAFSIPLVGLKQGSYVLEVNVQDPQTLEKTSSASGFEVMWSMLSWDRSLQDGLEELSLILDDESLREVDQLSPGDRENYMRDYWHKLDPTPETVQNEALQEYYRRLKFANENYRAYRKGMFTDQGRIYIKYGPPNDVRRDAAWGGVPGAGDISNPGASYQPGSPGHRSVDETGLQYREMGLDESEREAARLGGIQSIGKTYEIWIYEGGGSPLNGEWAWKGSGKKMKFVFVDQRGYGDLDLIYSSEGEDY